MSGWKEMFFFAYAKTKAQISCAVTVTADQRLCFSFMDLIVQFLVLLLKFEITSC